ncbi:Nif3-like dinuclear metal center hexameric protein [Mediterraneibacter glycyrrhizinilyticus]|jgi:dinuclear metal center YbgI/SA1388 family protein|uniref:Nif3-like dinuclear metal center hexameric protein n=1 Tax=Mediterraneibacter glycyrrhizinilyticus TaxID=342942 RepID=UPI0025AB2D6B|nr:Nif3-like dinuclear metal center hexameric protein [Mediterraneibacter glycyrrhizinilyticus]MDN0062386.1 Nif3-like dinuclear metal center hexameric protein [Mediterraneibacter glycyrrhizinilyticus]
MQCKEIMQVIEAAYPRSAALDFDNVGLLAGRAGKEVNRVYLALDATDAVIDRAIEAGADMLITHHPLIFSPMKRVTDEDFIGRRVVKLIQSDIAYYAMHTNYDVLGMATLSEKILGIKNSQVLDVTMCEDGNEEGIGRVGDLEKPMTLEECCVYVKHKLKLGSLKVFGDMNGTVSRLAVSPGSGKSAVAPAIAKGADVLVTGDIGHHDGLDAVEQGLAVIDAGHYGTEYIFIDDMKHFLEDKLPVLDVMTTPIIHPFQVI